MLSFEYCSKHVRIQRGGGGPDPPPLEKSQKYRVFRIPWKIAATKPAFNVRPSSGRQQNAI